jgi:hypothetical protein
LNTSAVPPELLDAGGAIVMPYHEDRLYYNGPNNLEINELKAAYVVLRSCEENLDSVVVFPKRL